MKLIKLSALLALAFVIAFANSGCKKGPQHPTPLPGPAAPVVGGDDDHSLIAKPNTDEQVHGIQPQPGIPLPNWKASEMNQDPAKFKDYTVYFAFDSSSVKSGEQSKLSAVAAAMQSDSNLYLLVEGYCDERGTEEYNRSLGERRALALREELVKAGIDANRIQTVSYGEAHPAVQGHNEAAWSKNRRGVFVACTPK
jgi:peptidoglycan-associated lipoprotein